MLPKIDDNTTYEELCRIEEELKNNPQTSEEDLLEIMIIRGEKGIELGYVIPLEEVYKELLGEELNESRTRNKCYN